MEKGYMGHMGPLGEEGVPPLGLGAKGWGPSPLAGALPPLGSLVPHGGGEEDGTPLGLYKEGYTPFFSYNNTSSSFSFSFPEVDSPCLESVPGLEFSTIRQAVALLESGSKAVFLPLLAWFGVREEHRLYRTCIISSRHYTCGATSSLEVYRESFSPVVYREVVVLSLRQPCSQERFPLSVFKGMNTDSFRYFTSP